MRRIELAGIVGGGLIAVIAGTATARFGLDPADAAFAGSDATPVPVLASYSASSDPLTISGTYRLPDGASAARSTLAAPHGMESSALAAADEGFSDDSRDADAPPQSAPTPDHDATTDEPGLTARSDAPAPDADGSATTAPAATPPFTSAAPSP